MDYDGFHSYSPVFGTAAGVALDGAHYTPSIDTMGWRQITFLALLSSAVAYNALPAAPWSFLESDDNATFVAPTDAAATVFDLPPLATSPDQRQMPNPPTGIITQASTSQIFHGSYIGKKRYVKGAFNGGAVLSAAPAAWTGGGTPTAIASATAVAPAVAGTYVVTTDMITSAAGVVTQTQQGTGNGVLTVSAISATPANLIPYYDSPFRLVCNVGGGAGSWDLFDSGGNFLGTLATGASATPFKDKNGLALFSLAITNGGTGWVAGAEIQLRITDVGVNRYILKNPSGVVVGNPFGTVPFSGGGLSFTIPDSPTPVATVADTCNIVVTSTAQTGQVSALMSHPWSAPIWQYAAEQAVVAAVQ